MTKHDRLVFRECVKKLLESLIVVDVTLIHDPSLISIVNDTF